MKTKFLLRSKTLFVYAPLYALSAGLILQGCAKSANDSASSNPGGSPGSTACEAATLAPEPVFTESQSQVPNAASDAELGSQTLRRRYVNIDFANLKHMFKKGAGRISRLELFEDRAFNMLVEKVDVLSENNMVAVGHVVGDPLSSVTLVLKDNVLVANFNSPATGESIEIRPMGGGVHAVRSAGADLYNDCQTVEAPPPTADDQRIGQKAPLDEAANDTANDGTAQPLSDPVVDMLVAYTPAAREHQGGKAAIEALIQMGVADTNQAFRDSGVGLQVRLVGMMETAQNESSDLNGDLTALRGTNDGKWDEIHTMRKRLGADQVTLVAAYLSNSSAAGIGYVNATASSAFTIMRDTYFRQYTLAHEFGHNLGLNHSDGLESSAGRFRTIIAYGSYPRIRRYSNPALSYNGYPTGDATHNESKILNTNATRGANLVATVVPPSTPATQPTPAPQKPDPTTPNPSTSGNCY